MRSLFIIFQYLVPQHLLSRLVGRIAASEIRWLKRRFIHWFIRRYKVDMSEAANSDPDSYSNFNAFFTRQLKAGARPVNESREILVCPADGIISELGEIRNDRLLQAKGRYFSLGELLGGDPADSEPFRDGSFVTVYLSPRDYHRVHMPAAGRLVSTTYIPGKLFSVNRVTANAVPGLFARNERLVCRFETDNGPMAQVMIGAMIVAGIDTVWSGQVCPGSHGLTRTDYTGHSPPVQLAKAAEMARFKLGSTVITLFGPGAVQLDQSLRSGSPVRMGEALASANRHA
ncbi:MAG: archaetidylserine decarboxylase [Pseudohongiellaceae bacterium]